jgi:hypothetical protein
VIILKIHRLILSVAALTILISFSACKNTNEQSEPSVPESGMLTVTFDLEKQSGYASNQFAVWVEDADGHLIKTLYATRFTANGGYKNRPDSIPAWVEKSGLASMEKSDIDAITGATPNAGTLSYVWDLTDANDNTVPFGEYSFFVEASLRWKNRVLYSGSITISDATTTAEASAEYFYEASDDQPALTVDSPENAMIGAVTARYAPAVQN